MVLFYQKRVKFSALMRPIIKGWGSKSRNGTPVFKNPGGGLPKMWTSMLEFRVEWGVKN